MERYPINLNEYEELAKKILPHNIWDYIEAGRGDEISLKRILESSSFIGLIFILSLLKFSRNPLTIFNS